MQFKTLAVLSAAATLAAATGSPGNQCTTGSLQCCNSTGTASDPSISKLLGLLGVVVQDVTALIGVTCTPITVVGAGGSSCNPSAARITRSSFYYSRFSSRRRSESCNTRISPHLSFTDPMRLCFLPRSIHRVPVRLSSDADVEMLEVDGAVLEADWLFHHPCLILQFSVTERPLTQAELSFQGYIPLTGLQRHGRQQINLIIQLTNQQIRASTDVKSSYHAHPHLISTMQFKALAAFSFASILAAATAAPNSTPPPSNQCTTGSLQCCDSTGSATDPAISKLLGLLGIDVSDVTALVGVTCSPITVIGAGGSSCSEQPVCCTDNSFNGVVALGCTPININL
ncbi:hypothetical protein CVT26_006417 [Gymnopilus dilepis]|uniref:Hydrophobin n=1 Tax=Gymnopilus dilepis TaxID=231916 RepID=A0A409Y1V1_9AGAR|nr:hypothetical protein CVT26_006417 [Gymnopilus dilepis]